MAKLEPWIEELRQWLPNNTDMYLDTISLKTDQVKRLISYIEQQQDWIRELERNLELALKDV